MVSSAPAAAGDIIRSKTVLAPSTTCLLSAARGRVTVSDLGTLQHMHLEVVDLVHHTAFFLTQHNAIPGGLSGPQGGEVQADSQGRGAADFSGMFSQETFAPDGSPASSVQMDHMGIWFADAKDAGNDGRPSFVTCFDGDHQAGIRVLSTSYFPDDRGPLLKFKEVE
jgi:hypothetical protein